MPTLVYASFARNDDHDDHDHGDDDAHARDNGCGSLLVTSVRGSSGESDMASSVLAMA